MACCDRESIPETLNANMTALLQICVDLRLICLPWQTRLSALQFRFSVHNRAFARNGAHHKTTVFAVPDGATLILSGDAI